jgi:hypothetical protein
VAEQRNASSVRKARVRRLRLRPLLGLAIACAGWHAQAQTLAQGVESLDRRQAEEERMRQSLESKPPGYVDRVMDPGTLPPAPDASAVDENGFRAWTVETRAGFVRSDAGLALRSERELGQHIWYRHQTVNHGDFELELDLRSGPSTQDGLGQLATTNERRSERVTLRNLGFPLTPRLYGNSALGDVYTEVTPALGRTYRLSLGTSVVRGASAGLASENFDLRAGTGQRGVFAGSPYPGFQRTEGELSWAGYSLRLTPAVSVGAQYNRADGIATQAFAGTPLGLREDVSSVAAAVAYAQPVADGTGNKARLVYVGSRIRPELSGARSGQGWFLESGWNLGLFRHEAGGYHVDGDLRFGDYPIGRDGQGIYWRADTSTSRYSWGAGAEVDVGNEAVQAGDLSTRRYSVHVNGLYRLSRWGQVGGQLNLGYIDRTGVPAAAAGTWASSRSANGSAYYQTRFDNRVGLTRFRASLLHSKQMVVGEEPATGESIEWEQNWLPMRDDPATPEFITTLGIGRDRTGGQTETRPVAGLTVRAWPQPDWSVHGTLRYTASDSSLSTSRGLSGSLNTELTLDPAWRVGLELSLNQARILPATSGFADPQVIRTSEKTAYMYLRWDDSAGRTPRGIGLREAGATGAGSVSGIVFLDADRDGSQQLNERGAPGVEVLLDGRFRTVTDRNGRFDFPLVTTGRHRITLTPETVPLPWGVAPTAPAPVVEVPLRGEAFLRIPVVRVGE